MNQFIEFVEIKNFKSIKQIKFDCSRINIFIGKPSSGKSSILEAISFLGSPGNDYFFNDYIHYETLNNLFFDNELRKNIRVETNICEAYLRFFNNNKSFGYFFDSFKLGYEAISSEDSYLEANSIFNQLNNNLKSSPEKIELFPRYFFEVQNSGVFEGLSKKYDNRVKKYIFRRLLKHDSLFAKYLTPPDGNNLMTILQYNSEIITLLSSIFRDCGFTLEVDFIDNRIKVQKKKKGAVFSFPFSMISDSLQRLAIHLSAIMSNEDSIIIFEEPEIHQYSAHISIIGEQINKSKENQFFISTYNPLLIHSIINNVDSDCKIFEVSIENYETKITELPDNEIQKYKELNPYQMQYI